MTVRAAVLVPGCASVCIRPARTREVAALLAVRAAALRGIRKPYSPDQLGRWIDATADGDILDAIEGADGDVICAAADAREDTGVVGFVRVGYDTSVHLLGLFVDPAWQRHGIGTALIEAAHARCRARQAARIIVAASLNAVPFYARHGYEDIERFEWRPPGCPAGLSIPALKMVKDLFSAS